jgi:glycosyltransferase involved in cell wall biosynthesis
MEQILSPIRLDPFRDRSVFQSKQLDVLMIFHAAPNPPPFDLGPTKRNLPLFLENLKRHRVSVLSLGTKKEEERFRREFADKCEEIVFVDNRGTKMKRVIRHFWNLLNGRSLAKSALYSKRLQTELNRIVRTRHIDIIHCTSELLSYYDFPPEIPVIGDTHNVEFDLRLKVSRASRNPFSRLLWFIEHVLMKREELANCRKFDAMIAPTTIDAQVWAKEIPTVRIATIENGVSKAFFDRPPHTDSEPNGIIFVGHMTYYPNRHGIRFFMDQVFPTIVNSIPDARLYVVGTQPTRDILSYASDNITITGFVKDTRPYIAKCKVFIVPLLVGGGIRGKVLEAMAMRIPIVSTSKGIEGIRLVHNDSVLIADSPEEFASAVINLLNDPDLREKLTSNAYKLVTKCYRWSEKGNQLNQLYHDVIETHKNRKGVSRCLHS